MSAITEAPSAVTTVAARKPDNKAERFRRISERRAKAVLRALNILSRCSNRSGYEYSQDQVARIFSALQERLDFVQTRFSEPNRQTFGV